MCLLTSHTAAESTGSIKQRHQGLLSWDLQLPMVLTPVPIPDMLGGSYLVRPGPLGVDLRFVLHLICSLMQQTRPTASLAGIKRLSALCEMEGTRVTGPFFF